MSHFTVLVIGDNPEQQLAPYQENNMCDCPKQYLEFVEVETENREDYEDGSVTMIKIPEDTLLAHNPNDRAFDTLRNIEGYGPLLLPWDDFFKVEGSIGFGSDTHSVPEEMAKVEVPYKVIFPVFEDYIKDWCGYEDKDPDTDLYGYWKNPNAKWDWYLLGGRWTGFFRLKGKEEDHGTIKSAVCSKSGEPGLSTLEAPAHKADQCYVGDVDWEAMLEERRLDALVDWGKFEEFQQGKGDVHTPYFQLGIEPKGEGEYESKDEFMSRRCSLSTFALVKNGVWTEKANMGWWGMASNEKERDIWKKQFDLILNDLPEDTLLSLYDCHI